MFFYVYDPSEKQWSVVVPTQPIDWRDKESCAHDLPLLQQLVTIPEPQFTEGPIDDGVDDEDICSRFVGDGVWVDHISWRMLVRFYYF